MFKFPKLKRSLALTLALLLSFSLFGCPTEELETAGEIIGTVADIADAVISESSDSESADSESVDSGDGEITAPPVDKELPQLNKVPVSPMRITSNRKKSRSSRSSSSRKKYRLSTATAFILPRKMSPFTSGPTVSCLGTS